MRIFRLLARLPKATVNYVRHDLRAILWPKSLPDPPGYVPWHITFIKEIPQRFRYANKKYWQSWQSVPTPQEQARENEKQTAAMLQGAWVNATGTAPQRMAPTGVMRDGTKAIKPMLQQLYKLRVENFRDALKEFAVGYREGVALGEKRAGALVDELVKEGLTSTKARGEEAPASKPGEQ